MGSVQFQIVPCSTLYLFLMSIGEENVKGIHILALCKDGTQGGLRTNDTIGNAVYGSGALLYQSVFFPLIND